MLDFYSFFWYNIWIYLTLQIMTATSLAPIKKSTKTKFRIGVVSAMTESEDAALLCSALEAMCSLGFIVSVLAEGDESARKLCFEYAEKFPRNFSILESLPTNKTEILEKSDVIIFPVRPSKDELEAIISAGVVPVLPEGCGLENFDAQKESGGAFTFQEGNLWSLVAALVRASENRRFSWDWKTIKQNLVELV